jgi:hypothetical protein
METKEIVERIMRSHWDMAACQCWICVSGREAGCRPRNFDEVLPVPVMDDKKYRRPAHGGIKERAGDQPRTDG